MRATSVILLASFVMASLFGCAVKQKMKADAVGATPITVRAEYDQATDFGTYTSWSWIPTPVAASGHAVIDDPEWRQLVDLAVESEMFKRGYVRDTQNPGMLLNAIATIEKIDKKYIEEHYSGYYFPDYHAQTSESSGKPKDEWEEGTLMIFIFDAATRQGIWGGEAKTEVYEWVSEPDREKRTREAIRLLIEELPARVK